MKQIIITDPKLKDQVCSSESPSYFKFKGKNTRDSALKVTAKCSCSCTTPVLPEEIKMGDFEIVLKIDKTGQTGNFNQSCHLTFSNGQTEIIYVSGTIK